MRGRGSRRGRRDAGIEPVELLVSGEDVEPALARGRSRRWRIRRAFSAIYRRDALPRASDPEVARALARRRSRQCRHALARGRRLRRGRRPLPGCADPTAPRRCARPRAPSSAPARRASTTRRVPGPPWSRTTARPAPPSPRAERVQATFVLGAEREGLPAGRDRAMRLHRPRSHSHPTVSRSTWLRPARSRCTKRDGAEREHHHQCRAERPRPPAATSPSFRSARIEASPAFLSYLQPGDRVEHVAREDHPERHARFPSGIEAVRVRTPRLVLVTVESSDSGSIQARHAPVCASRVLQRRREPADAGTGQSPSHTGTVMSTTSEYAVPSSASR